MFQFVSCRVWFFLFFRLGVGPRGGFFWGRMMGFCWCWRGPGRGGRGFAEAWGMLVERGEGRFGGWVGGGVQLFRLWGGGGGSSQK